MTRHPRGPGRRSRWRSDEGSGSVLTLAVAGVLVVLAVALGLCIQAAVAHARAQLVADLSALAAAREVQRVSFGVPGVADPCALAADVAGHDGGHLATCEELTGGRVRVTAVVETPLGAVHTSALAGPRS